jgi:beta-glucosidase
VLALEAGADLVLMPADARLAIAAIAAAVEAGRLDRQQLEASAERRRAALERCPEQAATPEAASQADQRLERELVEATLEWQGSPLRTEPASRAGGLNLVRVDQALQAPFLPTGAPALALPSAAGFRTVVTAADTPSIWRDDPAAPLAIDRLGNGPVLVQVFVRGNPFRGSAGSAEPWAAALQQLVAAGRLAALVVYGSPYLWEELRPLIPGQLPAAYSPGQMPLAQAAALAAIGLESAAGPLAEAKEQAQAEADTAAVAAVSGAFTD